MVLMYVIFVEGYITCRILTVTRSFLSSFSSSLNSSTIALINIMDSPNFGNQNENIELDEEEEQKELQKQIDEMYDDVQYDGYIE
ncbi:hypothetical protein COE30_08385 [Bacillus cereus]|nr:hypothetical protein COE30_08385 [Bacillus cereus]